MNLISLLLLILCGAVTFAHGGGLDSTGGHKDRKAGDYHCHKEPCLSTHNQTTEAMEEAENEGVIYSTLYNRDDWDHWIDTDGDCQDTRGEILMRDSLKPVTYYSNAKCRVTGGLWELSFNGGTVTNAQQLDIDHMIPPKWAHGHGGDRWSYGTDVPSIPAVCALGLVNQGISQNHPTTGKNQSQHHHPLLPTSCSRLTVTERVGIAITGR